MIHFTCDGCERQIDTDHEPRYVLRMEVYTAPESTQDFAEDYADSIETDPDRDHLAEIDDLLERVDGFDNEVVEPSNAESLADDYRQVRYDLCADCRKRMLSNPLGRLAMSKIDFSDN